MAETPRATATPVGASPVRPSTRSRVWQVAQALLLIATLWWAGRALASQWSELQRSAANTTVQWGWVALASAIVLGTYAMLIQSWRLLLGGWGSTLRYPAAVRIWTIANLGRYIPGKLWSIGALGVLAKREGVSAVAAASAAILGTLLNIGAGFGIMALSGARTLGAIKPWLQNVSLVVSVLFVIGTVLLPMVLPPVLATVARWRGLPPQSQHLPARTLWIATAMNALSWIGYGLAFAALARGIAPFTAVNPAVFIVLWTASYVGGYLVLYAPGGIGVRDVALSTGLVALGVATAGDAALLAIGSRVWLTVLEILPGLVALALSRRHDAG